MGHIRLSIHRSGLRFSHLPLQDPKPKEAERANGATIFNIHQLESLPVTAKQLRRQTSQDPILSKVLRYTQGGWPDVIELKPFHQRQHELAVKAGYLLWGSKVMIPGKIQSQGLRELHSSHQGIVHMKGLARAHVQWPVVNADIVLSTCLLQCLHVLVENCL